MVNSVTLDRLEKDSAVFDGQEILDKDVCLTDESMRHMQNWSLIGAAMRNELPNKANLSVSVGVMSQIKNDNIVPAPVSDEIKEIKLPASKFTFKKIVSSMSQLAVAASVAAVTVVGWQTYNAQGSLSNENYAQSTIEGVNLASYQTTENSNTLNLNKKSPAKSKADNKVNSAELKVMQNLEVERINNYIRGYVFDTASK
ncbi:MAG: RseA family anti-sigma factor [Succinivibrio sp.]